MSPCIIYSCDIVAFCFVTVCSLFAGCIVRYSLRPKIVVIKMDKRVVSRTKMRLDTSPFVHLDDKYFRTEGVLIQQSLWKGIDSSLFLGQSR